MSDSISRRNFLTASVAGVGMAAATPGQASASAAGVLPVRPLGMTGLMPTILGFGSGSQYLKQDEATAERLVHRAYELGVRYFDTAYTYGRNQESLKRLGQWLVPNYRDDVLIATKTGARDAETAKRQIDHSFQLLGTDRIDVLQMHSLTTTDEVDELISDDGALKVFRGLKESGAIRAIGITGHTDSKVMLYGLKRIEPDTILTPQNPGHSQGLGRAGATYTEDVIPYALKNGIGLLGMKVTGQDGLTGKAGITAPELVRYMMSLPIASAIIGMGGVHVLESCAEIARGLAPMSETELAAMRARLQTVDIAAALPYMRPGYVDGTA